MTKNFFSFFSSQMPENTKNIFEAAKAAFADFPQPVLILDDGKKIIFANSPALTLLGYEAEEIQDISPSKLSLKKNTLTAGARLSQKITGKSGKKFPARVSVNAVQGTELATVLLETAAGDGVVRDNIINLLDISPFGVSARDQDGAVIFWNAAAENITGLKKDDVQGKNLPEALEDKNFRKEIEESDKKIAKTGGGAYLQNIKGVFASGEKYLNIFKSYKVLPDGDALFVAIFEDVTGVSRENLKNRQVQGFLEAIINNIPLSLYARDKHGRYLINNKKSLEYFGGGVVLPLDEYIAGLYDKETIKNTWREEHETEEKAKEYRSREDAILKTGKILDVPYEEYDREGGGKAVLHLIKAPVFDENGRTIAVLTIAEDIAEKVRKEQEILETRNFLQAIFDNAPVAIYAFDINGKMLFSNKKSNEIFDTVNLAPKYPINEEENKFFRAREQKVFTDKKIIDIPDERYRSHDGEDYILHLIKAPVFDKDGNPFMVLTIAEDITEKRRREKDIIKAKDFLQRVVDNLPVALLAKKYSGEYILWNKKSEELFGAKADDVIGRQFYQTGINADLQDYIKQQDKIVFDSGREMDVPQEIISTVKDGVKIMHTVKTPVFDAQGAPDYLISVSEDITQKSKMERQLKESREKYSLLVENSGEGVVILEGKKIIFANAKFISLLGLPGEDSAANADILDFASGESKPALEEIYEGALAGAPSKTGDITMQSPGGEAVELETNAVASKYMGKKIVLMFFRDVTEQNKLVKDLRADREYFKNSFEFYPVPLALLTPAGYLSVLNAAARAMLGLKAEDRNIYRTYYLKPQLPLDVRKKMSRGEAAEFDFTVNPSDIDPKIFKTELKEPFDCKLKFVSMNKRENKDGGVTAEYLVIMEKKTPPKTVIDAEDVLLFSVPALKCSNDGKIISVNTAFSTLELPTKIFKRGTALNELFVYSDRYILARDTEELFRQGFIYNRFYKLSGAAGELPVTVSAARGRDNDGFIMTFQNVTAQEQFLTLLRERQEVQSALLSAAGGAVLFCGEAASNIPGKIIFANGAAQNMLGYHAADIIGMNAEDFLTPPAGKPDAARALIDGAAKELHTKPHANFTSKIYTKDGASFDAEIIVSSFESAGKRGYIFIIRVLNELIKAAASDNAVYRELNSIKNFLDGVLFKTDAEAVVTDGYTNSRERGGFYNIARYQYKSPYGYLPKDVADVFVYSVKEALSVNTVTSFNFTLSGEDGVKSYEARVSPVNGEQSAFVLISEVANLYEMERKIQALYEITNSGENFTEKVNDILNFGKQIFNTDAGMVIRFSGKKDNAFTILYACENKLNLKKGMMFPGDKCLDPLLEGNVIIENEAHAGSCGSGAFCKEKKLKTIIAGPLYVGGKVEAALMFVSRQSAAAQNGDEEFIALMSRLLGLGIELRNTGKLVEESEGRLEHTFNYLTLPAAVIEADGSISFLNKKFLKTFNKPDGDYKGKDFFEIFTPAPPAARKSFFAAYAGEGKTFVWDQPFTDGETTAKSCRWQVNVIKNPGNEVTGFALIGEMQ
ncbi:MAG: PAS domain S-box protein [Elusimicrobium sp.]|jgi:PAS domain S-box-containing protein|nr:PAS domain S-box protein [Elusimicrobium sp.]